MRLKRQRSVSWFTPYKHCKGHEIGEGRRKQPQMANDGTYSVDGDGWPE
jgi:hypothetical protein